MFKLFDGVVSTVSASSNRIKVQFDSTKNANTCILSPLLGVHGLTAVIPTSLLYYFGVIRLDICISEDDFWEGHESPSKIISFRRINVKRNGSYVPSRFVEQKFFASSFPKKISIYKVIFNVSPSIRSPTLCNKCLRFGHTQKFCQSKQRCSHCGESDHVIASCEVREFAQPKCVNCSQDHPFTDRSCKEWLSQRELKKTMACKHLI